MLCSSAVMVQRETFASLAPRWNQLWPGPAAHPIFGSASWHEIWWRHFADAYDLLLIGIHQGDQLIGVAPFKHRDRTITFIGDADVTDFLDLIVVPAAQATVADALVRFLDTVDCEVLDLHALRPESATLQTLPERLRAAGWAVETVDQDTSPAIDLPATWDDYLGMLNKKDRHELRRKLRRLEEAATVRIVSFTEPAAIEANLADFFQLHRLSRSDKASFMTPAMEAYFRDLFGAFAARGHVRLELMEIDGARVATTLAFESGTEVLLYNSGYDPAYAHLSVGLLLKALGIKGAIERGKKRYDFLRGNERYKYDLGARDVPIRRLIARRRIHDR